MSMLYPRDNPNEIRNIGERQVALALLEQCPTDWRILHSKQWLIHRLPYCGNIAREGEIDFVVLVPGKGIVCLEVKSARKYRIAESGHWERFDQDASDWVRYKKTPWRQVNDNKHALVDILKDRMCLGAIGCAYEAAVLFPRGEQRGSLPLGEDGELLVIDANGMGRLAATLENCIDQRQHFHGDTGQIERLLFKSDAVFCRTLSMDIQEQDSKLIELTDQQSSTLDGLRENKHLLIRGGAGTGKTVLALEAARRSVESGRRVLYVCFSRKLAEWVSRSTSMTSFVALNYHRLAYDYVVNKAGMAWPNPETIIDERWQEEVAVAFIEAVDRLGDQARFDTVIVDEAQDFQENWYMPLIQLWNEAGQFIQFGDENQVLFDGSLMRHPQVARFLLGENCRNTKRIAKACDRVLETAGATPVATSTVRLPDGKVPVWRNPPDLSGRKEEVVKTIKDWVVEGLTNDQIAVLAPTRENSLLKDEGDATVSGIRFTREMDTWRSSGGILVDTIKGFKGLEADAVILLDIPKPEPDTAFTMQDAYVAFSRAKHLLVAIARDGDAVSMLSKWFKL